MQKKHELKSTWSGMVQRCVNPRAQSWSDYGGRGIRVCDRWAGSFEAFLSDMGERPSARHSLDRINNNGHYEAQNCRWATKKQQARNMRSNRLIAGISLSEVVEKSGINYQTVLSRIDRAGWSVDEALGKVPFRRKRQSDALGRLREANRKCHRKPPAS